MENKYFTPSLEDLRVGYECEKIKMDFSRHIDLFLPEGSTREDYEKAWDKFFCSDKFESEKFVLQRMDLDPYIRYNGGYSGNRGIKTSGSLRTPYLTKEQIEAEGWEITLRELKPEPYKVDWINATKGEYKIWINLALHQSMHLGVDKDKSGILFRGQCKDINTFRYICKLLNIC